VYQFDDCQVDPRQFELRRGGDVVHVEPQVFALLAHLIEHRDRVVTKAELLDAVWGNRFVSESALTSRVKMLRRAVGDDGNQQRVIATVHGIGYRFTAEVTEADVEPSSVRPPQQIRYCVSPDGVRVAYAGSGTGPPLVKAANWLTHLDLEWSSPIWAHWLDGLAQHHRLVRYDERGCGLSDWEVADFSFDAWVNDLELVVDAAGLCRGHRLRRTASGTGVAPGAGRRLLPRPGRQGPHAR
jgi:DNA-binding winged helix-turn-helix (wHTH) protein